MAQDEPDAGCWIAVPPDRRNCFVVKGNIVNRNGLR